MAPWTARATLDPTDERAFITVRELMRLEGEQALEAARQRRGRDGRAAGAPAVAGAGTPVVASATEVLRLIGIYGVGKRLFAEVRNGSHAWVFQSGHSLPVGQVSGGADVYRLKELNGACVRLERSGDETVLCLPRGGRQ